MLSTEGLIPSCSTWLSSELTVEECQITEYHVEHLGHTLREGGRMDAAKMALSGGDVTAQYRRDLGQLLADLDLLLSMLLEILKDLGIDHDAGCVVRHPVYDYSDGLQRWR
jgi:hypothetical protein